MATANESLFYSRLADAQKAVKALESVLNIVGMGPSEDTVNSARQKLGDLKMDAATYLAGNKSKAVIAKLMSATENWDYNKAKGANINTIARRVSRYLEEVQTIVGLPENQVPAVTGEAGRAAAAVVAAASKVKAGEPQDGGMKLSGGLMAAVAAGAIGLLWFLKRK